MIFDESEIIFIISFEASLNSAALPPLTPITFDSSLLIVVGCHGLLFQLDPIKQNWLLFPRSSSSFWLLIFRINRKRNRRLHQLKAEFASKFY
jgi:hypothetical protein